MQIKSKEAQRLARKLSRLTGQTVTKAVIDALRHRIERVKKTRKPGLAEALLRIGRACAAEMKEPYRSADHGDLL